MNILNAILENAGDVSAEELTREFGKLLIPGENIDCGYKVFRDVFIFTNKRLILINKQGLTGNKTEFLSVMYKSISRFSVENTGYFDLDAELKIWISSEPLPSITKRFNKQVDVYEVQRVLAKHLMQ